MTDLQALHTAFARFLPAERIITDPLRTFAYGTDASFYRLTPKIVLRVDSEAEVRSVLAVCHKLNAPLTFRAAGTSLSGQAVTDSVLVLLGDGWNGVVIERDGLAIRLQPGVIGAEANRRLASYARKIGPDPASIDSAKIGGIAANNSSGMCCGTSDNSYQTVLSMRLILADGTLVDTADPDSVAAFRRSHAALLAGLDRLGQQTRANTILSDRIRRKYAIKNTTGYSLNALTDFTDPLDILIHLLIGSEGTLGFIAQITYRTVPDPVAKASALLLFPDCVSACQAVAELKSAPVAAVELMDRAALRSVEGKPGMPSVLAGLEDGVTALLVETRASDSAGLDAQIADITARLTSFALLQPPAFTADPAAAGALWKIRKGLFPAVGAVRPVGTTVIIEDVGFRIPDLAAATADLQALFIRHGYHEAIIFGHALDGNLHFVFTQDFSTDAEVARYAAFMDDVAALVVDRYDGALKAEHGTGRNMAPFVEREWGSDAYALMWDIKRLLDPAGLLNPGVILDTDPQAHLKHLKPLPPADPLVDACIECGFCERMCPSHGLTLSPRQRITGWREISRAKAAGQDPAALEQLYGYQGLDTCAACGLCATACPVGIETGRLTKALRHRNLSESQKNQGQMLTRHYGKVLASGRLALKAAAVLDELTQPGACRTLLNGLNWVTGGRTPMAGAPLPLPAPALPPQPVPGGRNLGRGKASPLDVVYLPSCANRLFGSATADQDALVPVMLRLLDRAGITVRFPAGMAGLCCGQAFESKGQFDAAAAKTAELNAALLEATGNGAVPVLMDASACSLRMIQTLDKRLQVMDSLDYLHDIVLPRLPRLRKQAEPVMLHLNCSARRMDLERKLVGLAEACAETVLRQPPSVTCCGFAGDKGFTHPELNSHALRTLDSPRQALCEEGYSSNRTCEIGLSAHSGYAFQGIAVLLDKASR